MKTIFMIFIALVIFTGCETKSENKTKAVQEELKKRKNFKKPINSKSDKAPTKLPL